MSTPDTEAIDLDDCHNMCHCKELCPPVTPTFHASGNAKTAKEERHGRFGAMILWNNFRRLVLKMSESESIDAPVVPLMIVAFSEAVPMVVLRGMLGEYAHHAPE